MTPEKLMILDAFGYAGYALLAVGMILLARGNTLGWAFRASGEVTWTVISYQIGLTSGVVFGVLFLCIDLYGVMHNRKETSE